MKKKYLKVIIVSVICLIFVFIALGFILARNKGEQSSANGNTIPVGKSPSKIVVNPYTNKIYVKDATFETPEADKVTVVNGETYQTKSINMLHARVIGINYKTNRFYVGKTVEVLIIDGARDVISATVPIAGEPYDIAINEETNQIFFASLNSNIISVLNGENNEVRNISLPGPSSDIPKSLDINSEKNKVYCTFGDHVNIIDGNQNSVEKDIKIPYYSDKVVINPRTNKIYASHINDGKLTIIDGTTYQQKTIDTVDSPSDVKVNTETNRIYLSCGITGSIDIINGQNDSLITTLKLVDGGLGDILINSLTDRIYSASGNKLFRINGQTSQIKNYPVGKSRHWLDMDKIRNRIYVTNEGGNTVSVIKEKATIRLSGDDRYQTAVEISKRGWASSDKVILARGDLFPDALSGAALAGKYKAPILLTHPKVLTGCTRDEIKRLSAKEVYILGSDDAIYPQVVDDLINQVGISSDKIHRLGGIDRYETSTIIANELSSPQNKKALMATGENFPDALSASSLSYQKGMPLLLVKGNEITEKAKEVLKKLNITSTVVLGGNDVVSDNIFSWLSQNNYSPERVFGDDRYKTAKAVGSYANQKENISLELISIAKGEDFPDALAIGPFIGKYEGIILLSRKDSLEEETEAFINAKKDDIYVAYFSGGSDVLSDAVKTKVSSIIGED